MIVSNVKKKRRKNFSKDVGHLIKTRHIDRNFNQFLKKTGLKPVTEEDRRVIDKSDAHVLKVHKKLVKMQNKMEKGSKKTLFGKMQDQGRKKNALNYYVSMMLTSQATKIPKRGHYKL